MKVFIRHRSIWYSAALAPLLLIAAIGIVAVIGLRSARARFPVTHNVDWAYCGRILTFPLTQLGYLNAAAMICAFTAVAFWADSLRHINTELVSDLGLISVLPMQYFAALGLLTIGFCIALKSHTLNRFVVTCQLGILTLALYGTPAFIYDEPRGAIAFRHAGLSEMISRTGVSDPLIDAYTNWPGFFAFASILSDSMGFESALTLVNWSPLIVNLIALGLLGILITFLSGDRRLAFMAMWVFLLGNWFGQDYFAPQAVGFLIYLALLSVLLTWFLRSPYSPVAPTSVRREAGSTDQSVFTSYRSSPFFAHLYSVWKIRYQENLASDSSQRLRPHTSSTSAQRILALLLVITLFAAIVFSHQVTPVAILISVTALVILNRITPRDLPLILGVMLAAWWVFMATSYFGGHLAGVISELGAINQNVQENVTQRLSSGEERIISGERELVLQVRMLVTGAFIGLAVLGVLRRIISGYSDVVYVALALAPISLLVLGSHGGEILIRAAFFSLPFISVLVALLFLVRPGTPLSWRSISLFGLVSIVLMSGFLVARYGNERMDSFTTHEVAAVDHIYEHASPGSLILAGTWNTPWLHSGYEVHTHEPFGEEVIYNFDAEGLEYRAEGWRGGDVFVVLTRSQRTHFELLLGGDPAALDRVESDLQASQRFQAVVNNEDATVFQYSISNEPIQQGHLETRRTSANAEPLSRREEHLR